MAQLIVGPVVSTATDPVGFADHTWPFARTPEVQQSLADYKAWCAARGVSMSDDIVHSISWDGDVGFEPSWAPYNLENEIEHWVLWHHPNAVRGDAELAPDAEKSILAKVMRKNGTVLPADDRLLIFQNVPSRRSLPTIAHSHVFFRPREGSQFQRTLSTLRAQWESRALQRRRALGWIESGSPQHSM